MEITQKNKNGIQCLKIEGRLDAASAADAEKTISYAINSGNKKILINLEELKYISSAGLRALLVIAKEIKLKNGKIVICSMIGSVKKIFDISGFTSIFDIEDTEEKALETF